VRNPPTRILRPPIRGGTSSSSPQRRSFSYLQNTPPEVIWETVIDRSEIEAQILKYNRGDSFCAAANSPCGHGIVHDELIFTGLSPTASGLLQGIIPDNWPISDDHLQSFLASFTIPDTEKNSPPISTTLSTDDVSRGFKQWREKTTTSPSGRHLGHYKALTSNPTLLNCLTKFLHVTVNKGISLKRWRKAVNVMIEKDPGVPNINRLRIIHPQNHVGFPTCSPCGLH
jgi:hypothetical protein